MGKSIHEKIIFVFGIYLFVLGILAVINSILNPEIASFFWFCYIALILIGIGMIFKNPLLIFVQLIIYFIPLLIWNFDFFYVLFTGNSLFGITDYFFSGNLNSLGDFISLQHIYIIPLVIYSLYVFDFKKYKYSWLIGFFEMSLLYFVSFLGVEAKNPNCVFYSCVNFINLQGIVYSFSWFAVVFIFIFISDFVLNFLLKKLSDLKSF